MKILLVEDNEAIAKALIYSLEQNGYMAQNSRYVNETKKIFRKRKNRFNYT